jgi:hypothetical protein
MDSRMISVELSGVTTIPFGKALPSATWGAIESGQGDDTWRDHPCGKAEAWGAIQAGSVLGAFNPRTSVVGTC